MRPRTEFTLSDGSPLTPQEQFVLKQAASGEIADLKEKFGGAEEERRLRARFLEELLSGDLPGVRIHRRGNRSGIGNRRLRTRRRVHIDRNRRWRRRQGRWRRGHARISDDSQFLVQVETGQAHAMVQLVHRIEGAGGRQARQKQPTDQQFQRVHCFL